MGGRNHAVLPYSTLSGPSLSDHARFGRLSPQKTSASKQSKDRLVHPTLAGGRISSVFLRKLVGALSLCGLLTSTSAADTSLCTVMCASRVESGASAAISLPHHDHHSAAHSNADHRVMDAQGLGGQGGWVALNSGCGQYLALRAVLGGSRTSLGETISNSSHSSAAVTIVGPNHAGARSQSQSPSPPRSNLPHWTATTPLRI
jgi:hypothetical protein